MKFNQGFSYAQPKVNGGVDGRKKKATSSHCDLWIDWLHQTNVVLYDSKYQEPIDHLLQAACHLMFYK